ncbi:MAG: 30S ribosomal protein S12 methylthiotransferase RimO [Calditerrivibrio sp.]|uniref:30S ribosomal protein S12 methylthiotransferase RimO n=1 Tax=Calditerrivibrio sp. TaxID=2792612 RepID=UPI003D12BF23
MRVAFISLGCPKNQTDLEYLIGDLVVDGFEVVTDIKKADAIVVNTCGFLKSAVSEAVENILDVAYNKKKKAKLIVSGCMVERYKDEIAKELPEVDFWTGVGTLKEIAEYLKKGKLTRNLEEKSFYGENRILVNHSYYAYLKIAEGCNNRCSYCTIPFIRGNLISRPRESIIKEAEDLVKNGVKELIIISQDTTKYGIDKGRSELIELLNDLVMVDGEFKIRLLYLNPDGVSNELVDFVANQDKMIKYFEIPVQHIDDEILKKMNRKSDSRKIKSVFEYIRSRIPEAIIRTTFIVGFPGEDDVSFEKMVDFVEEYKPDFAGFFPYSREEGTKAYNFESSCKSREISKRISRIQKIQKINTLERLKRLKKGTITLYVEQPSEENPFLLEGRAEFQAPEIDGKAYILGGVADKGYGPYKAKIKRVIYPDIYCEILE